MSEYSMLFVVLMGMGVVFFGLVCIILLVGLMGKIMKANPQPAAAAVGAAKKEPAGMQAEILAAITAALSEEVGISSGSVNITSIKKI